MNMRNVFKRAVLGAGTVILFAGFALAQTPPAPAAPAPVPAVPTTPPPATSAPATPPAAVAPKAEAPAAAPQASDIRPESRRGLRRECREKSRELRGSERRDAMRKCMGEGRADSNRQGRGARRAELKEMNKACRVELKDQRFTEAERRKAMQDCMVKKEPKLAKGYACRDEAETKKLERRTPAFRSFMRDCVKRP